MKEKAQGFAILEEVKAVTFSRFLEWLYTGSYTLPPSEREQLMQDGVEITTEDCTDVYVGLAELYVFADSRDIGALKTRVLRDLRAREKDDAMAWFTIADIVSYIYENTTPSSEEKLEPLRAFAMDFCSAFDLKSLVTSSALREVICADQGELFKDFMWMLGKKNW